MVTPTRRHVTVVGNPGLDTLVLLHEAAPDLRADGHFVRNVDTVGHAAAFCARTSARLGHWTRVLGSVGRDVAGTYVREVLAADGVDLSLLFRDPDGTARSVNLVRPDGGRTFFYHGGSHMTLTPPGHLVQEALAGADLVLSTLANWARHVVVAARERGIPVAVDLQDVRDPDDPYRRDFVAAADHLFASAAHVPDPVAAAAGWFRRGPARTVVFGMGPRGALLVERAADGSPRHRLVPPPLLDLPIVDTTGAGDSLATGFLDGLLLTGMDAEQAVVRGQVVARVCSSAVGGDAGFDRARIDGLVGTLG